MMRATWLLLLTVALIGGCATVDKAQFLDGATTWYGLGHGYVEGNPVLSGLSGPGILIIKMTVTQAVKLTPESFCWPAAQTLTVTGFAATVWNLAMLSNSWWAAIPVVAIMVWEYWDYWWQESWLTCQLPLFGELSDFVIDEPLVIGDR